MNDDLLKLLPKDPNFDSQAFKPVPFESGVTMNHKQAKEYSESFIALSQDVINLKEAYLDLLDAVKGLAVSSTPFHSERCLDGQCECGTKEAWDRVQKIIGEK
jgi:hypothetical protein